MLDESQNGFHGAIQNVTRQRGAKTGQTFLQGRETADADRANVFADAHFNPIGLRNRPIAFEVEVQYQFFEGTVDDHAEVHTFWAKVWRDTPDGPRSETIINGEDFCAYHEDEHGEWAEMLRAASERIRNARYNHVPFEPRVVGAPDPM